MSRITEPEIEDVASLLGKNYAKTPHRLSKCCVPSKSSRPTRY
jgi:hypothetical protein